MKTLLLTLTLLLTGCSSAFHLPYEHVKQHCGMSGDVMAARCRALDVWGYSIQVPGGGTVLGYFGT
jgi:hypothetical protein